jgi:hypothetical protein
MYVDNEQRLIPPASLEGNQTYLKRKPPVRLTEEQKEAQKRLFWTSFWFGMAF